jgi:quercetin dioxygenase-like cupin family protein
VNTDTLPYQWNEVKREQVNALLARQAIHGEGMTVARLEMSSGCLVPQHSHHNEQISMVEKGRVKFTVSGNDVILSAGDVLHILPNLVHSAEALEDSVAVELFCPRRDDWIRGDDSYLRK